MMSQKIRRFILPLIPAFILLIIWEITSNLGYIDPILFPPPSQVWLALRASITGDVGSSYELLPNVYATMKRLLWGFLWGSCTGVVIGVLMGNITFLRKLIEPLITFLMPIPGIAMAPLFMVIMGFGDRTIITVAAVAMFFPVVLNTMSGVRSVDRSLENAAYIMGASRLGMYLKVQIPWTMIYLITGLKLGLARCWRTIIAVELIATATHGLGFMITEASDYLQTDMFFAGIFVMAIIFLLLEKSIFGTLEKITIKRWGMIK